MPPADVVTGNTPLFFSAQGSAVQDRAGNFHFPRHISVSNHEYEMESMETNGKTAADKSDGFAYRLDPNRVRTDAEVAVFAEVFQISVDEARRILKESGRKCQT